MSGQNYMLQTLYSRSHLIVLAFLKHKVQLQVFSWPENTFPLFVTNLKTFASNFSPYTLGLHCSLWIIQHLQCIGMMGVLKTRVITSVGIPFTCLKWSKQTKGYLTFYLWMMIFYNVCMILNGICFSVKVCTSFPLLSHLLSLYYHAWGRLCACIFPFICPRPILHTSGPIAHFLFCTVVTSYVQTLHRDFAVF